MKAYLNGILKLFIVLFVSTAMVSQANGNTATITSSLQSSYSSGYLVQWTVTLSSPATENIVIPCITTNATNTGTMVVNVSFSAGQQSSGANTVMYTRLPDLNYTATCTFGAMPAGYSAGGSASYIIDMLITANITATLQSTSPGYLVQWGVTLSSPALENMVIPCITTNATNTGNTVVNVYFSKGQSYSGANTLMYTRLASSYTATCTFGNMPSGYIAGQTGSMIIPKN